MVETLSSPPDIPTPGIDEATADERLAVDRHDVTTLVAKGDHRFLLGDHRGAVPFYAFALKCAAARGVPDALAAAAAQRAEVLREWLADRFRHHIFASLEATGWPSSDWPDRFSAAVQILLGDRERDLVYEEFPQMPTSFFYPGLPYVDFVDPSGFPWRSAIESAFDQMREEGSKLLESTADFSPYVTKNPHVPQGDVYGMLDNPEWSSFYLWSNGSPIEENTARCPTIFSTVTENVPLCHIGRRSPVFMLSLLKAGAQIPPHTGMSNFRYLCHLPLVVPGQCYFRVGERTVEWKEGKLLVFDDSVEHSARNDSERDRLILIFDVWHPDLSEQEKTLIRTMLEGIEDYR